MPSHERHAFPKNFLAKLRQRFLRLVGCAIMAHSPIRVAVMSQPIPMPTTPSPSLADFDTQATATSAHAPFVLVDGSYYLFRCFHGLPPLSNKDGLPTNAVRGVLNALNKLMNTYHPTHMAVAFDTKAPTFRHTMSEQYKANRPPMDEALRVQIPYVHRLIKALGICLIAQDGYEADDIIGTLAYRACAAGQKVVISTGDKDMAQLVNDRVILEDSFKGTVMDKAGVFDKFGVYPCQVIDLLTLMGDASDGIMGVPKVGAKTASRLLQEYHNLDNIVANAKTIGGVVGANLASHQDQIAFDKKLATIITNLNLPYQWDDFLLYQNKDKDALLDLYEELEFAKELKTLNTQADNAPKNAPKVAPTTPKHPPADQATAYHTIHSQADFDALIERLKTAPYFAIDTETTALDWQQAQLVGISLALQGFEAYYIPLAHTDELGVILPNQLAMDTVLDALKPLLEDPAIGKIGQHLKYDCHILGKAGINLTNSHWQMDTMLASYVLNAAATRHNMDDLARHYLGVRTTSFEDIAGKGAKQLTFDKIALDSAAHYACEDADITFRLFEVFVALLQEEPTAKLLLETLEIPASKILTQMEHTGILVNRKFLMELSGRFDKDIQFLQNQAFALADEVFNLASPKQLGLILFDKLGIAGGKKTKTGQYSTSEEVLSKIDHPLVEVVLEHRGLSKLKSTYADALGKAADKQGRVHTSYHQALTSTGRLSSSDPNLQNIPIRTASGKLIRKAFVAPEGRVILAADYSQIELRLMAHFSQDQSLIEAFLQGIDIHTKTASEILGKPIDQISSDERRSAKAVNFGLLYGMSAFGLARQLKIDRTQAKLYMDGYFRSYPTIYDYMERTKAEAEQMGYVKTLLGRRLYMPDVASTNRMVKDAALRAAINAPLQGSAADIIKLAMVAVDKVLPKERAALLLQVHDELVFEVEQEHAQSIGAAIKDAMEGVINDACALGFEAKMRVPLVAEIGIGDDWGEAH